MTSITNISRPDQTPEDGDTIEITNDKGQVIRKQYHESNIITVTARHFTQILLGTTVFAELLVVRDTLAANVNTISVQEKQVLGLLNAAAQLLAQNGDIELDNPDVELVLDVCVSLQDVSFDAADKARVLANGPYIPSS